MIVEILMTLVTYQQNLTHTARGLRKEMEVAHLMRRTQVQRTGERTRIRTTTHPSDRGKGFTEQSAMRAGGLP